MIYTDPLSQPEFVALDAARGSICASIYLPTTPVTRATKSNRILFKDLSRQVVQQLEEARANKRQIAALEDNLSELHDDDTFWAYLADGLAVFATPKDMRTFRLPVSPAADAQVSDRFHVKPLVPVLARQGHCFVLALSQGAVRLVEITPSFAQQIKIPGLPKSLSDAVKRQMPRDRAPSGRLQGSEGMKLLIGQYCRAVDRALRPVLAGKKAPLILACVDELAPIYRANNSYPHLAKSNIKGNSEQLTEADLADAVRPILRRVERRIVSDVLAEVRAGLVSEYASTDVAQISHAAARGQIRTLLIDTETTIAGTIDPSTGHLELADGADAASYDVLDEIVGLTVRHGGDVLPTSTKAIGTDSPIAAVMRFRD